MTAFRVGDMVEWTSQSAGVVKCKRGVIQYYLSAGAPPPKFMAGKPRNYLSYLVRANGRLYWPRVSQLALASPMDAEQGGAK